MQPKPMRTLLAYLLFVAALIASVGGTWAAQGAPYPATITDFGEFERFPAEVAGYHRGNATAYAPNLVNYSIAYDQYNGELHNTVTLYFYPKADNTAQHQQEAESAVFQANAESKLVSRRSMTVPYNGQSFAATLTTFEYERQFAGKKQRVSSQLLMVFLPTKTFKVRSTAPLDQAARAEAAMLHLLEGLAWAS